MLDCEEKSRKASGTMHSVPLLTSSSPMGQAHTGPLGGGRNRHRWLHPLLLTAQGFVPVNIKRETDQRVFLPKTLFLVLSLLVDLITYSFGLWAAVTVDGARVRTCQFNTEIDQLFFLPKTLSF